MAAIDNVVKGLGIAALHLNNLSQKGTKYSALHADVDCCLEALALLKEQEAETIECEMCGHRLQTDWNWCPWCRWETALKEVK